ncbi:SNF2 helicase associated domain-containing protein [Paenibacillus farraposensis]|uniref:SNF2 helicase associated domain-containing protein n=1 Tax=Paenibacillus farraposensis TaxID=2807095 RepID=A0ABW4D9I7_9BACL|nr:SNF2 helicase associated domain-containing protein [Paenibacillus farraposensis]MCC3379089.1 DEAD/DEAH box helicase [Paenibacillus farraposensis]
MSFELTRRTIRQLCSQAAYDDGDAYYRAKKVAFTQIDHDEGVYEATVKGSQFYAVAVMIRSHGSIRAECTCSTFQTTGRYCKHIAAVLINAHDMLRGKSLSVRSYASRLHPGTTPDTAGGMDYGHTAKADRFSGITPRDLQLTDRMLKLFGSKRPIRSTPTMLDTRTVLDFQFVIRPFAYGYQKYMFGIEIKAGPKRLYIVQKIRSFLDRIDRGDSYRFTKSFTYEPQLYRFRLEHDAILQQLVQICRNERMIRETSGTYVPSNSSHMSGERMLLIPPAPWEKLLPLLTAAQGVHFEIHGNMSEGIPQSDLMLPLQFEFDEAEGETEGYQLSIQGLDDLTIMEDYGVVIADGKLVPLKADPLRHLSELKRMVEVHHRRKIRIAPAQMESFIDKVVPGLMKFGRVHMTRSVSDRVTQQPLKAKLYLDRVRDKLLASLEFQYGDIVINPLETDKQVSGSNRILIRDGEQEQRILELMDHSSFAKTESGYVMEDEDSEFDFLYHTVPQLEKLLAIYATGAVKAKINNTLPVPRARVEWDEHTDLLEFTFDIDGIPESEVRQLLKSLNEKKRYHRLPNGALLPLDTEEYKELIRFINETGIRKSDLEAAQIRIPVTQGLYLIDPHDQAKNLILGKAFRQLLENIRNPDHLDFPVPDSLAPILRDYQVYGFQWLKTLAHYRFGGILADDMGLGKTLQSIAFLVSVLPEIRSQQLPAMIVSPASLVYNWRNELEKFAPHIRVTIADGTPEDRGRMIRDAASYDVLITSYPLLRRDAEMYSLSSFHTLILDEAQAFKNHATQTAQAVKDIKARYRFALTGTPIENTLEELWSIFDIVFPELFPGGKSAFHNLTRNAIAKRIRPFLLRRLKSDVLQELPEKIESVQISRLLPEQKKLYMAYLAELQHETLKHLNEEGFQKNRIKILAGLTRLRQLCCHPGLFVDGYTGSSAKYEQLLEIIAECLSSGKRMLIFSQFTTMLQMIRRELAREGVPYFYLDGQTPASERVELCSRFNEGERDLFLISLKAGGTGLNLTGADTVILYDLWWNPAVEEQATNRAHRMGQKKVVQVIRLVTQGTVEDKMYELQKKKKHLIDQIIQPGQESLSALTELEIRELLMI